jgi:hypothetical protein
VRAGLALPQPHLLKRWRAARAEALTREALDGWEADKRLCGRGVHRGNAIEREAGGGRSGERGVERG